MGTKNAVIALIVIVILAAGLFIYKNNHPGPLPMSSAEETDDAMGAMDENATSTDNGPVMTRDEDATSTATSTASTKTFTVDGSNFKFVPSTITVKKGDTVRIVFNNTGGRHDWRVDELNAATRVIGSGESQTIEFAANKVGSFEYYCSVGEHRQMGMRGILVVTQ